MTQGLALTAILAAITSRLAAHLRPPPPAPLVVGICGAQGCGKTTLTAALIAALQARGIAAAAASLDDFYFTRAERQHLAQTIHPLLATRGVPGTHDVALALDLLDRLAAGEAAPLPRFDKARDDPLPPSEWGVAPARTQVFVLEGWCVGAVPQPPEALAAPVNALEAGEDAAGQWRAYANAALGGAYQRLFARIDLLVLLAAPGFAVVERWRGQQEDDLRQNTGAGMEPEAIARFIAQYERLTRHILIEMPARADIVVSLDADRVPTSIVCRA